MNMTPSQLCEYYLDGNDEAAFEVLEHVGPEGLKQFLGFGGAAREWIQLYKTLLDEYGFLERLCQKYQPFMSQFIFERGVGTFREIFQIEDRAFDFVVVRVWEALLDARLEVTMKGIYSGRRKSHFGTFFVGLRSILRGELGEV